MTTQRRVVAHWEHADGTPWEDAPIEYRLARWSYMAGAILPSDTKIDTTDGDGNTATTLWTNIEGVLPTRYTVTMPDGSQNDFVLPAGDTDITLDSVWMTDTIVEWDQNALNDAMEVYREEFALYLSMSFSSGVPHDGDYTNEEYTYAMSGPRYHVDLYGAIGNATDAAAVAANDAAFAAAFAAAYAAGGGMVVLASKRYSISKSVLIKGFSNVAIQGEPGATLVYPSSDTTIPADPDRTSAIHQRSGLFFVDCQHVTVRGMTFEGDSVEPDIFINTGRSIDLRMCLNVRIDQCNSFYGGGLLAQEADDEDTALRVSRCYIYGSRNAMNCGHNVVIEGCHFELPGIIEETPDTYDRIGNNGSSHAIYIFAGRRDIVVTGCTFKNMRETGVKVSGSSDPIREVTVTGCIFENVAGPIVFGADDRQEHSGLICTDNQFIDCPANVRPGWGGGGAVGLLGCKSALIANNNFYYTRDGMEGTAGKSAIGVGRYLDSTIGYGSPVEMVAIKDNVFHALQTEVWAPNMPIPLQTLIRPTVKNGLHYVATFADAHQTSGTTGATEPVWTTSTFSKVFDHDIIWVCRGNGDASSPGSILQRVINIADVGFGAPRAHGTVEILGNQMRSVGGYGIMASNCLGLIIDDCTFDNIGTAMSITNCRLPTIGPGNLIIAGFHTSSSPQLRLQDCSFPIIHGMASAGRLNPGRLNAKAQGRAWGVTDNINSGGEIDFPLRGVAGRCMPSEARPEVVFAYGSNWTRDDTVVLIKGSTTLTYTYGPIRQATNHKVSIGMLGESGGTFQLTVKIGTGSTHTTTAIAYNASATTVQLALEALSTIVPGDVVVGGANGGPYIVLFQGAHAAKAGIVVGIITTALTGPAPYGTVTIVDQGSPAPTNHVVNVGTSGTTGGTYTLSIDTGYGGVQTTGALAWNITGAALQPILEALPNIGVGNVTVTGPGTSAKTVTFLGTLAGISGIIVTADSTLLTGSSPSANVTLITAGSGRAMNDFASCDELAALIDRETDLTCRDFGADFTPAVVTRHLRVRSTTVSTSATLFSVHTLVTHATAGVVLANGTAANVHRCFSRGNTVMNEDTPPVMVPASRSVIWSPLADMGAFAGFAADNAAGQALIRTNGYMPVSRAAADSGSNLVIEHGGPVTGTEEFRWSVR